MTISTRLYTLFRGELVGTDSIGNRYYRLKGKDLKNVDGRAERRWVILARGRDASLVPPEWHAWLHYTSESPLTPDPAKSWRKEHQVNPTGTAQAYLPPGHDLKGGRRERANGDYQAWQPT